jgi:xanthine/CO dehydrogenase XdhC/CoxF family maturation factor
VECITPQPAALIFGGGHISKSLAKVLDLAGFRVSVIDNREAYANRGTLPRSGRSLRRGVRGRVPEAGRQRIDATS